MSRVLPAHPNLEHLKKQAKDLLHEFALGSPETVALFSSVLRASTAMPPKLADAQHLIAHEYGFASWAKLKEHVESLATPFDPVKALVAALNINDEEKVEALLQRHPELKSRLNDPLPGLGFDGTPLLT